MNAISSCDIAPAIQKTDKILNTPFSPPVNDGH